MPVAIDLLIIAVAAFLLAFALTWLVKRIAIARGILDHPNERSSHVAPTPRGGGIAIVAASVLGIGGLFVLDKIDRNLAQVLLIGGTVIAVVGYLDDRRLVGVRTRFLIHAAAAIGALYCLGGLPSLQIGHSRVDLGWLGQVLGAIAIMWTLNLFNFMDGIDGIAASEAIFVTTAGAALCANVGMTPSVTSAALTLAAAASGFLLWNWPPAKIFMGDVGSGYLGYVIAVLALAASRENGVMIFVWLILGGVFFVDATVTLVRRFCRRERVHVAHRSHAYQRLSRRWNSHGRVSALVWVVNFVWLMPLAGLCLCFPDLAGVIAVVALAPLCVLALVAGAGAPEESRT